MIVMEISVISLEKLLVLHCCCKWKLFPNAPYVPCLCVSPLLLPRTGLQNNFFLFAAAPKPCAIEVFSPG